MMIIYYACLELFPVISVLFILKVDIDVDDVIPEGLLDSNPLLDKNDPNSNSYY